MAKKVAVPDGDQTGEGEGIKVKKKHGWCFTCCITALIVTLVILIAVFVTGWVLGDKYTKRYFDMSLGETLGVVNDLYWADDSDVVTRPFTDADLQGFYSEIKRNVLLKDSAEIDFDKALNAAIDKYVGAPSSSAGSAAPVRNSGDGEDGEGEADSDITDIFVNMIAEVLQRDNIDVERLNKYDENDPATDEYIFNLNDKQLAAFINTVLKSVLKNADKLDGLSDISGTVDVQNVVALKQIRFTTGSEATEGGETKVTASSADITVWVGLQDVADGVIKRTMTDIGVGWAGGFVGWLGDVFLPENLYLTLSVPLYGEDNKADIVINDMDASEQAQANKLINALLKQMGGENTKTLDGLLDDIVDKVKPLLEKATEKMDFQNANEGTIKMDLLDAVAQMASDDLEGEPLTKADFLFVLQALLSDKTEQLNSLTPYRYDNWYLENNKPTYMPTGGDESKKIDYEQEFIKEIERVYAIDFGEDGETDLSEVLGLLGISLDGSSNENAGSTDLLNKVDSERFNALLETDDLKKIKLKITDRMLGAALSGQMDTLLKGNAGMEDLSVDLISLTFINKANDNHQYAVLAVEVDLKDMLGSLGDDGGLMTKLTTGLMPDGVLLTVTVDITRDRSVARDPAEFVINSCAHTDRALATIEKLVPDLKLTDRSDEIGAMLNDMLDALDDVLDIELQNATVTFDKDLAEYVGEQGAMVMPDIFTVMTDMVLTEKDDAGNPIKNPDGSVKSVVTPDELRSVIRDLNNPANIAAQPLPVNGYMDFINNEVLKKYYFVKPTGAAEIKDFTGLTNYLNDFNTDKLRVNGSDGIAHDNSAIDELKPVMKNAELRALLVEKMRGNASVENYAISRVETGNDRLSVMLSIELAKLLNGAGEVNQLIHANELFVTATFRLDEVENFGTVDAPSLGYAVDLDIDIKDAEGNNAVMSGDTYDAMLRLIRFFAADFDIEQQVREFGVILYEQMQDLNKGLAGEDENRQSFKFTTRGLELTDFYTFLALKLEPELLDMPDAAETIKKTVQGLYLKSDRPDEANTNNYRESDIVRNTAATMWSEGESADYTLNGGTRTDVEFAGYLKRALYGLGDEDVVKVEQTVILAASDPTERAASVRTWVNSKLKTAENAAPVKPGSEYLMITFGMSMQNYLNANDGSDASGLFPSKIYATVVYEYVQSAESGKYEFKEIGMIFNNMSAAEFAVMEKLMGSSMSPADPNDTQKVNMTTVRAMSEAALNGITRSGTIVFAQTATTGIGQLTYTPSSHSGD